MLLTRGVHVGTGAWSLRWCRNGDPRDMPTAIRFAEAERLLHGRLRVKQHAGCAPDHYKLTAKIYILQDLLSPSPQSA